jgi:hypothetical protein
LGYKPLEPGLYIVRFLNNINAESVVRIIDNLNLYGEKYEIKFIPEQTALYQIVGSEE